MCHKWAMEPQHPLDWPHPPLRYPQGPCDCHKATLFLAPRLLPWQWSACWTLWWLGCVITGEELKSWGCICGVQLQQNIPCLNHRIAKCHMPLHAPLAHSMLSLHTCTDTLWQNCFYAAFAYLFSDLEPNITGWQHLQCRSALHTHFKHNWQSIV